jgi:CelD/BcsL family acetyltransferase involved in cellulose biosynthesis
MGKHVEVTVVTNLAALTVLRDELSAFGARTGQVAPTADPHRFIAETEAQGNRPYVVVVRDGDGIRGVILGRLERRGIVCRIGYVRLHTPRLLTLAVVHGGIIASDEAAAAALCAHLATAVASGTVEQVEVNRIDATSPIARGLRHGMRSVATERSERHWRARMRASGGDRQVPISGKTRYNRRREDRRLEEAFEGRVRLRVVTRVEEVQSFIRAADSITALSYHSAIGVGVTDNATWRAAGESMASRGHWRAYLLEAEGRPVAYVAGAIYLSTFTLEAMAFVPELSSLSAGGVLLWRALNDLVEHGVDVVDFGFGDAQYKQTYGTESHEDVVLRVYGPGVRPRIVRTLDKWCTCAHQCLTWAARSTGVADRVKRTWRRRLATGSVG